MERADRAARIQSAAEDAEAERFREQQQQQREREQETRDSAKRLLDEVNREGDSPRDALMRRWGEQVDAARKLQQDADPGVSAIGKQIEDGANRALAKALEKLKADLPGIIASAWKSAVEQQLSVAGAGGVVTELRALGTKLDSIGRTIPRGPFN
jgi:histidinol dehydrogenase